MSPENAICHRIVFIRRDITTNHKVIHTPLNNSLLHWDFRTAVWLHCIIYEAMPDEAVYD